MFQITRRSELYPQVGALGISDATSLLGPRTRWLVTPKPSKRQGGTLFIDDGLVLPDADGIILRAQTYCCDWADGLDIDELRGPGVKLVRLGASVDDVVSVARDGSFAFTDGLNRYAWLTKRAVICSPSRETCTPLRTAKGMLSLDPALSPDGRMVAFIEARGDSQSEIGQAATRRWYTTHTLWLMQAGARRARRGAQLGAGRVHPSGRRTGTASCSFQATRCGCCARRSGADRRGFAAPLFRPGELEQLATVRSTGATSSPGRHRSDTPPRPATREAAPGLDRRGGRRPTTRSSARRSAASGSGPLAWASDRRR